MNYTVSVLTLYSEKERQEKITDLLNLCEIDFDFFKVNRNDLFKFPNYSLAETGCTISHMMLTDEFIKSKNQSAYKIVLEDDAIPTTKLKETLEQLDEIFNNTDFDVLMLGYNRVNFKGDFVPLSDRAPAYITSSGLICLDVDKSETMTGTFGYVMSKKGAHKLKACREKFKVHADAWNLFMRSEELKVLALKELVVEHDHSVPSTIGQHSPMKY